MTANLAMLLEGAENTFPITTEMLSGVTNGVYSAIQAAAPIGIGIMVLALGVNFVPKLIKKFSRG